jgi:hypothetical protein
MFFAYDTEDDLEPLKQAADMLNCAGFSRNQFRCYVLIGYPKDTFEQADKRLREVFALGALPMAMLWRDDSGRYNREWRQFQRLWARPPIIKRRMA